MKKVAVLIYEQFCNFEISVALEMLAMAEKPFVIISKTLNPIRSEEGFSDKDLQMMIGWDENLDTPIVDGYIQDNNIITSVSYNFIKWAMAFGRAIGIDVYPKSFGLEK